MDLNEKDEKIQKIKYTKFIQNASFKQTNPHRKFKHQLIKQLPIITNDDQKNAGFIKLVCNFNANTKVSNLVSKIFTQKMFEKIKQILRTQIIKTGEKFQEIMVFLNIVKSTLFIQYLVCLVNYFHDDFTKSKNLNFSTVLVSGFKINIQSINYITNQNLAFTSYAIEKNNKIQDGLSLNNQFLVLSDFLIGQNAQGKLNDFQIQAKNKQEIIQRRFIFENRINSNSQIQEILQIKQNQSRNFHCQKQPLMYLIHKQCNGQALRLSFVILIFILEIKICCNSDQTTQGVFWVQLMNQYIQLNSML